MAETRRYVIVRTFSAGVHAGMIEEKDGKEVRLSDSRRIWYWEGAATLSELAVIGPKKPKNCKFSVPVSSIVLTEAIEIIDCTPEGEAAIRGVQSWLP